MNVHSQGPASGHGRNASRNFFPPYSRRRGKSTGSTLLELIVACAILLVIATVAVPLARNQIRRTRENQLRWDLRQMRDAIDRYKDTSDKGLIQVKAGTEGYPTDLESLVKPTQLTGANDKRIRFLREIPEDPMTKNKDWGLRSVQDDVDATGWGGQDVFDVYSKSTGTALDGTKYSDW
ncbi:MAG TPA: type II secretion system protein [Candidatus Acidoferrales bacterium]